MCVCVFAGGNEDGESDSLFHYEDHMIVKKRRGRGKTSLVCRPRRWVLLSFRVSRELQQISLTVRSILFYLYIAVVIYYSNLSSM